MWATSMVVQGLWMCVAGNDSIYKVHSMGITWREQIVNPVLFLFNIDALVNGCTCMYSLFRH